MLANGARIFGCVIAAALTGALLAGDNCVIQVGDRDGFGLGDGAGLLNFAGDPVNVDGGEVLGVGDFLPDWNQNGAVAAFSGDDFDMRTFGEVTGTFVGTWGLFDVASFGSQFTDLSMSRSYDETFGLPNDFPDPPSTDRNDAFFVLDFSAAEDGLDPCGPVYFKMVFSDVGGGEVSHLILTMPGRSITTDIQPIDRPSEDGVIRSMIVELDFEDLFTLHAGEYLGYLEAELVTCPEAPAGDAYYAIDYVQIWNPAAACYGDMNRDHAVDVDDLLALLAAWGTDCEDQCAAGCEADLNGDAVVDVNDLLGVLSAFGECP